MEIIFTSERIDFIRPMEELVHEYVELINNPEVYHFITDNENNYSIEDEIIWVRNHQTDYTYTMIDRETGNFIGNISFNEINGNSGELGIVVSPEYQNRHYGMEALEAIIRYGFEVINLDEITLVVYSNNHRAIHCYNRLGFKEYRQVANVKVIGDEAINDIYMSLRRQI